jgi:hypothetical protein
VAVISQPAGDGLPTPASEPASADQHIGRHPQHLLAIYPAPNDGILTSIRSQNIDPL